MATRLVVPGFRAAGVHCGIKRSGALDLALIASDVPCAAAGVFTTNTVVGAPVELTRRHVRGGRAQAVLVNSGISNVAMGADGRRDAAAMARLGAEAVGCVAGDVLVASTGVIGEPLPMARIARGVAAAAATLRADGLRNAARAIMTTDRVPKWASAEVRVGGRSVRIAGIAKGVGMLEPHMATMLAFVLTDADVSPAWLRRVLRDTADASFNRISVDGEQSTSDMALVLANGAAANATLRAPRSAGAARFETALGDVCTTLAKALARDGEGATKLVRVLVRGARSGADAERAARRIANSLLVKTAIFGRDANWGRILQTVGAGRTALRLDRTEVRLCGVPVFRAGRSTGPAARRRAASRLRRREVEIDVRLGRGRAAAEVWTCDLSYDYVRINAEYTT